MACGTLFLSLSLYRCAHRRWPSWWCALGCPWCQQQGSPWRPGACWWRRPSLPETCQAHGIIGAILQDSGVCRLFASKNWMTSSHSSWGLPGVPSYIHQVREEPLPADLGIRFGYTSFPSSSVLVDPDLFGYRNSRWQNELSPAALLIIHFPFVFHRVHRASSSSQAYFSHLLILIPKKQYESASSSNTQGGGSFAYYNSQKPFCLPKFSSSPPEKVTKTQEERIVSQPPFFRGELLNFGGVLLWAIYPKPANRCRWKFHHSWGRS